MQHPYNVVDPMSTLYNSVPNFHTPGQGIKYFYQKKKPVLTMFDSHKSETTSHHLAVLTNWLLHLFSNKKIIFKYIKIILILFLFFKIKKITTYGTSNFLKHNQHYFYYICILQQLCPFQSDLQFFPTPFLNQYPS
jgi:hypothetical protein